MSELATLRLAVAVTAALLLTAAPLMAQETSTNGVTFRTKRYGCALTVFGRPAGRVETDRPLVVPLTAGREYLIECESHDIPVKLYDRRSVGSFGGPRRSGAITGDITINPVAVLPNLVRAAAAEKLEVRSVADARSIGCKADGKDRYGMDQTRQIAPDAPLQIPVGIRVRLTSSLPKFCENTNLIEVIVGESKAWFRNKDFVFSFGGEIIPVYSPSQNYDCCWIE